MKSFRGTVCFLLWVAAVSLPAQIHAQSEPAGKNAPLAIIDAIPITENDLNVQGKLLELEHQAYQLRRRALENAISRRILEKAAAEKKLTGEELLKQEVDAKIPDPSPREVEAFYLGRKDKFRKPFPEVRQQAARMLKSLRVTEARAAYTAKLRQQSSVEILLAPMRFPVEAGDAPRRGPATAPVTIVEFSDFQCPYCKRTQATLREILARYGDQVSLVFKDLPLTRTHREAQRAAEAARCAGEQGKYWEYHDALYAAPRITTDSYQQIARSLGLEADLLQGCLDSRKFRARVQDDVKQAGNVGASSTPTFFINGILLKGAQPVEAFAKIIDEELAARRASR